MATYLLIFNQNVSLLPVFLDQILLIRFNNHLREVVCHRGNLELSQRKRLTMYCALNELQSCM